MFLRNSLLVSKYNARSISTTLKGYSKNHYAVLELSAKATHAEIKSAYYKLSKVYHPDKNQGSLDAATKFRDITEAYEILGNVRTRKLYDKGVHVGEPKYRHPAEDDDPRTRFYRSREHRHRATGRTPIYDFDEWSRAHYGATFARDMERKRREQFMRNIDAQELNYAKSERIIFFFMIMTAIMIYVTRENFDTDRTLYDTSNHQKTKPP